MTKPFMIRTPGWQDQAACLGETVAAAFPWTKQEAREFIRDNCDRCPVIEQCAAWATLHDVKCGIWGGVLYGEVAGEAA